MAAHRKPNENQTALPFRFGEYELHPSERMLRLGTQEVALSPKAFDALLCLVSQAGRLVRKSELLEQLWPNTHVGEASLTNVMVSLRKVLGRDAIQTVSKHGYRFTMAVSGEPGVRRETYERFVRARELIHQRSIVALTHGRELLWMCLAEDPGFAPAWAWLGRASWVLGKFKPDSQNDVGLAQAAYERAFQIDPNLAIAHQFYTPLEADLGDGRKALARLLNRLRQHPEEPEAYAGLVQVYRFCGLLEKSLEAHARAKDLDPAIATGVAHTLFLKGDFAATIEFYGVQAGYYLDAAAWAALGETGRARTLLKERMAKQAPSPLMGSLGGSLLALLDGHAEEAVRIMHTLQIRNEPEALVYLARHESQLGLAEAAMARVRQAASAGFVCAPVTLETDPWFAAVRRHAEFAALLAEQREQSDYNASLSRA